MKYFVIFAIFLFNFVSSQISDGGDIEESSTGLYTIEGKVYPPEISNENNWQDETLVFINSGELKKTAER